MKSQKTRWMILAAMALLLVVAGCHKHKAPAVQPPPPTCADVLSGQVSAFSARQVENILNDAWAENKKEACWMPLMKHCLDQNADVPHRHLARAVDTFNRYADEPYFHKALFRYFSSIDAGYADYSASDKELLKAYCRHVIHNATSQRDPNVRNAELLTSRLDAELYEQMFKY
jgi:hypothetical protein